MINNRVFGVIILTFIFQHSEAIGKTTVCRSLTLKLSAKVAYFTNGYTFFNSEMQDMNVGRSELRLYSSKLKSDYDCKYRSVFIRNQLTTPIKASCYSSGNETIGTLTLQPGFSYFYRFYDDYWSPESYSCVVSYTATKQLSFDAYGDKAPIAYQNGFEIRANGIYLIKGTSRYLYKGEEIMFLGIGGKLTNGFALPANNEYRVIQFENRKNGDAYISCTANDGTNEEFIVGGRRYTLPKRAVYKFAVETGNFEKGIIECVVRSVKLNRFKVYGEDSYGQYKRGSEYYFINQNDTVTFKTIVNFEIGRSEIANTDPKKDLIQIANQMGEETYVHCWGKQSQESPQINVGLKDYRLQSGEVYRFSIPVDSFKNGFFWCDIGGIYPNSQFVKVYGYEKVSRSSHFYSIGFSKIVYRRKNGEFVVHY